MNPTTTVSACSGVGNRHPDSGELYCKYCGINTPTHSPTETVKAKGKQYKQGGLDALERYLEFHKIDKDHIRFWKEWWLKVLSLDEEVGL